MYLAYFLVGVLFVFFHGFCFSCHSLASWAALLKGSYPPKSEKPEISENTHPACSSLSLSHLCIRVGKKSLRRRSSDPSSAMPCCKVWELFHPPLWLFAFPSVKSGSWTWWRLTASSAFFPISVSGFGTPLTVLQRDIAVLSMCCLELPSTTLPSLG